MKQSEILNLEIRRKIYNYIKNNPGLHLRELSRRLHISYHNLRYHIDYLKKLSLIAIKSDNSFSRVYIKNKIGIVDQKVLNILRQKTPRFIILLLFWWGVLSQKELSKHLDKHPTTIEFHLKKLLDIGIIEPAIFKNGVTYINFSPEYLERAPPRYIDRSPVTNETLYRLTDPGLINKLFIIHKKSLMEDKIFRDLYKNYVWLHKHNKDFFKSITKLPIKPMKYWEDLIIEILFDMFPHPYHAGSKFL